ncbi:MAG: AsmA-like C-terminal domain-containing protein [Amphiplicatus sp.]
MASLIRRARRAGLIALEIAGVLIAVAAGLAGFLYWRLQAGPLSLGVFRESAEFAVERALPPGYEVAIGAASLAPSPEAGRYDLVLDGLAIAKTGARADIPRLVASFVLGDLARGGPSRLLVEDAVLRIDEASALSFPRRPKAANGRRLTPRGLRRADLRARIEFAGAPDAGPITLAVSYRDETGVGAAALHVEKAPLGDLLTIFLGPEAGLLSAPLTGDLAIDVGRGGEILAATLAARLDPGVLRLRGRDMPVSLLDIAARFDPSTDRFDLDHFRFEIGGSRGELSGAVEARLAGHSLSPAGFGFALKGESVAVAAPDILPEPLVLSAIEMTGDYDIAARRLSLASARADFLDVALAGAFSYARPDMALSPAIKADLALAGALDRDRLLKLWPLHIAEGARDFVAERMPRGEARNMALTIDLPAGAIIPGEGMPDEAMTMTFDIADAVAIYTVGMTPITRASGSARLTGNRFVIEGARGRIGPVPLTEGEIDFTALHPRWRPVHFRFTAAGAASDILGVLNEKPLELLKKTKLDPSHFIGDAVLRADIIRPNKRDVAREDYGYAGKATFKNLSIAEFYAGIDVTGAAGEIALASRSMTVTADAQFGGAPINFRWRQKFYAVDGPSEFRVTGEVDSSTGDIFGVPTRALLRGPVAFDATATGDLGALKNVVIDADFEKAALTFDAFGWMKPQGVPAKGSLDLAFGGTGVDVRNVDLRGDGVDIRGAAALGEQGLVRRAAFERVFLDGAADFTLTATRAETGAAEILMTGPFLDAGPLVEALVEGGSEEKGSFDWGNGVFLRGRIDSLALRKGVRFRDAALDIRRRADALETFDLSARTEGGAPISMALADATAGPAKEARIIEARTSDIGALMAGVFGVASIKGGEGSMRVTLGGAGKGVTGLIDARHMRVVGAPLLARIFSAGSLGGLADLLNGEGIELNSASAAFDFKDGVFTLEEARAAGPSVGLTASGSIARGGHGGVDLNGAVAPVYQLNSMLGRAPVIGDLLVGREGEGVVALAYHVTGPVEAPTVAVNPLSALAPGFLRRMFEPAREAPSEPGPPPSSPAPSSPTP